MKHTRTALILAAGSLVFVPMPAAAQSADDIRCVLVSNFFMRSGKEEKAKRIAEAAAYFYLGRVDHFPPAQLRSALARERKALAATPPAALGPAMNNCARTMAMSGKNFDTLLQPPGGIGATPPLK